ncbi:hypothetical protein BV401_00980 [Streptomyces malaysiensis subsp. malaysiensis]|uniref:Polyketide synthase n=2 Tax=Streptomyces TaxID=1883 RepID=A0ABN4VZE0_9ACTN|nr:hypothetical protein BV401_00980 [Streptomyces autolyticus]
MAGATTRRQHSMPGSEGSTKMSHTPDHTPLPWLLSADSAHALREKARRLDAYLRDREPDLDEVGHWLRGYAAIEGPHRAAVDSRERTRLLEGVAALAGGGRSNGLSTGRGEPGDIAFVFPGAGSQWPGMAAGLLDSSPVFRARMDDCAQALEPHVGWSLIDVARDPGAGAELARADVVQPVLFAVMVSLAELWRAHGVTPSAVVGHSLGEVAAAAVSEALSLDDAARVAALWSRAQSSLAGRGDMVSVRASADEVRERLAAWGGELVLAADNGPATVLVSGGTAAAAELIEALAADGVSARRTSVGLAAHSPQMEEVLPRIRADLAGLRPRRPRLPFHSSLTAGEVTGPELDAEYWCDNIRRPVRFQQTVRGLLASGRQVLLEVSPHPVLTSAMQDIIEHHRAAGSVVATLRRHHGGPDRLTAALGELWAAGARADWPSVPAGPSPAGLSELLDRPVPETDEPPAEAPADTAAALAALPDGRRRTALMDLVCAEVAAVLGRDRLEPPERRRPFLELGLDSVTAMEVRNRVTQATGLPLPAAAVFDHPSPVLLAEHLVTVLTPAAPPAPGAGRDRRPAAADEPVAIVGMGCRLPGGVRGPEDLWRLLDEGRDAVAALPADRGWDTAEAYDARPRTPGRYYQREAGLLQDAPLFDAEFFGVSPREALAMDPQQRLLLETSWEALEAAGIRPDTLHGSRTGVFTGLMTLGYGPSLDDGSDLAGHVLTGTTGSVASGRVAYTLGLQGPAVTVDTACSSSLVALHLAAQSLRSGESDLALAGGVTVMPGLGMFLEFSQLGALAPDGRCKAFADTADGFGLAEGAGVLVLQRLSDARAQGRRVLAVVRGSAVNQDGASSGLTAPNGPAQQRVIREALAAAGLAARDIDAVEAHGTGTTLGDLIEADALLATYGQDRDGRPPLRLGSLKSNIGHTQAAAGVAGVIKTVLAMRHGTLPRTLHVDRPSSRVDWGQGQLELLTRQTAWPETDRPLRAGVSSFGISGTNAHVILESAAPEPAAPRHTPADALPGLCAEAVPWVLSGKTRQAVRDQAARLLGRLEAGPTPDGADIGWSLVSTRAAFEYRAAVVGTGRDELLTGLRALATGEAAAHLTEGRADDAARVAFVFPGQGAQWAGMARPLLDTSPVFARAMAECAAALTPFVDWSLLDIVDDAAALERVDVVQPVLWAVMVSLAELWRSYGVEPAAVAGHSQGEIAAACVAGALSLQDGARVVALRSQAVAESLAGLGGMVALPLSEEAATDLLGRWAGRLSLAAVNGPSSTVVSGEAPAVDELLAACGTAGIRARRIPVDYASHSPQVERIRDRLLADLAPVTPGAASVPAYSCTTGEQADTRTWDARHWYRNLRETVRFDSASRALVDAGVSVVLEVSPHPVLVAALQETLEAALPARPGRTALGTLRRDDGGPRRFLLSLAQLHTLGVGVRWEAVFGGAREVELPTYAFQHRRFWPEAGAEQRSDALDTEFWATVERADLGAVAAALGVADETLAPVLPALSSWRARRTEKSTVDQWHYRESWTPLRITGRLSGSWLLVVDDAASEDPWTSAVTGAFAERAAVLRVQEPDRARLARELTALSTTDCAGVVVLVPDGVEGVVFVLVVLQAVLDAGLGVRVWAVTRGAVSVGVGDGVGFPVQGGVWVWGGLRRWSIRGCGVVWWMCRGWWMRGLRGCWVGWLVVVGVRIRLRCGGRGCLGVGWCVLGGSMVLVLGVWGGRRRGLRW